MSNPFAKTNHAYDADIYEQHQDELARVANIRPFPHRRPVSIPKSERHVMAARGILIND